MEPLWDITQNYALTEQGGGGRQSLGLDASGSSSHFPSPHTHPLHGLLTLPTSFPLPLVGACHVMEPTMWGHDFMGVIILCIMIRLFM